MIHYSFLWLHSNFPMRIPSSKKYTGSFLKQKDFQSSYHSAGILIICLNPFRHFHPIMDTISFHARCVINTCIVTCYIGTQEKKSIISMHRSSNFPRKKTVALSHHLWKQCSVICVIFLMNEWMNEWTKALPHQVCDTGRWTVFSLF